MQLGHIQDDILGRGTCASAVKSGSRQVGTVISRTSFGEEAWIIMDGALKWEDMVGTC